MNILLKLLLFTAIGLTSCDNKQTSTVSTTDYQVDNMIKEIGILNDFLKQFESAAQTFKVEVEKPTQVKGKNGIIIFINPSDLESENGNPLGKEIIVELKELKNQKQLLKNNAQTISDGQLLISDGAYFIEMISNGQRLKLKDSKTLEVKFPKTSKDEMTLFYGERDSLNQMNWKSSDKLNSSKSLITKYTLLRINRRYPDSVWGYCCDEIEGLPDQKYIEGLKKRGYIDYEIIDSIPVGFEKYYDIVNIKKLGWINCDKFYEIQDKTDLQFVINKTNDIDKGTIAVYLAFNKINSVVHEYYWKTKSINSFKNIPVGYHAKLIAVKLNDGKVYSFSKDITISPNQVVQLDFVQTNEQEIGKLFDNI